MKGIVLEILNRLVPRKLKKLLRNYKILTLDFGQWQSIKKEIAIDKQGNPIPWYTYPAIEYLKRFDLSDKSIFEWGCGNSSFFWARKAKEVVSVEDDKKWFSVINKNKLSNQKVILLGKDDYVRVILNQNKKFDIIVIDGKYRHKCSKNAVKCLSEKGLIILDNSDWFPMTAKTLREYNLIQVDFSGFGPINNYTWTTSLFFSRNFDFKIINQPLQPIGGLKQYGDE